MSQLEAGEGRNSEIVSDIPRTPLRCRIPQRLSMQSRQRAGPPKKSTNFSEKVKHEIQLNNMLNTHNAQRPTRPRSSESRPRSGGGRLRQDSTRPATNTPSRPGRPDRSPNKGTFPNSILQKSIIPRKTLDPFGRPRPFITVPVPLMLQKLDKLPDQDLKMKREDQEMQEAFTAETEKSQANITQMKSTWDENIFQFEKLKGELDIRQKNIMELYATIRNTHKMLIASGQMMELPCADDLSIMNVAKLTPEQLLQLCATSRKTEILPVDAEKGVVHIDMNKLYDTPTKLVATCEQTLLKRKEIIDWFETLKTEEKGISMHKLTKKINEFNAENEMLNCSLQTCKTEFLKELNEIVDYLRKGVNETIALQLRAEELTYELTELHSLNNDLRKQLHANDHLKSQNNRHRVEELEKELKEEKCKKTVLRERLSRAEGQLKIGNERAAQVEAALEQVRSQNWTLERTVQQLHDQNQKLQSDFDKELNTLTQSIKENTSNLDEIVIAREKLQKEKDDLEKKVQELTESYRNSLANVKEDLNKKQSKLFDTEHKLDNEKEEKKKLESKLESLCSQLLESELRYKDALKQIQEKDALITKTLCYKSELECAKRDLELANLEIGDYRVRLVKQTEAIRDIEHNFKESIEIEKVLKANLKTKEDYIAELEKKQPLLEKQLQESERKMESYEKQLTSIKEHIAQLNEEFGEFENISDLHEMISQQRATLSETTERNNELLGTLKQKNLELEHHQEQLLELEGLLEEKEGVIKMLTDKEEEQANIIKLLRNNLEMRAKTDNETTQQLAEKNAEIESLVANLETRKEQITELEKIILTLEEQVRKNRYQRKRDHEKLTLLEKAITDYESYHIDAKRSIETPVDNLDNLIKILEEELGTCFEPKQDEYNLKRETKAKYAGDYKINDAIEHQDMDSRTKLYQGEQEKMPTKIVMGNFVKKTYIQSNDDRDNLDRKKAITNMDTTKWVPNAESSENQSHSSEIGSFPRFRGIIPLIHPKEPYLSRNLQFVMANQREEKKCKMFKFAGHRL